MLQSGKQIITHKHSHQSVVATAHILPPSNTTSLEYVTRISSEKDMKSLFA